MIKDHFVIICYETDLYVHTYSLKENKKAQINQRVYFQTFVIVTQKY